MSRIQNILEKAEREGAVRRMRNVADGGVATEVATFDGSAAPAPPLAASISIPIPAPTLAPEPAPSAPGKSARLGHVVTDVHLDPRLVAARAPSAVAAEQYRALRTRILHADNASPVNVILVTSPGRGEGKTLTAANLALTMAQDYQRRICVVDANLRQPQLHHVFGLTEGLGLSDVLLGQAQLGDALISLEDYQISVLPAGSSAASRPAELLGTTVMRRTLEALRSGFDRVVIDAPPAVPLADVGIITPLVDTVLLVVRAGITSRPAIHDAVAAIDDAKLLGIVLNETMAH